MKVTPKLDEFFEIWDELAYKPGISIYDMIGRSANTQELKNIKIPPDSKESNILPTKLF